MFFPQHISWMAQATSGFIAGVSAAIFFRKSNYRLTLYKSFNSFYFF